MSKITSTSRIPAEYNRQAFYEIFRRIDEMINRYFDGYLFPVKSLTSTDSPYTVNKNDSVILANTTGGSITINLLAAEQMKEKRLIVKKTAAANTVTIDPNGSETIDGAATLAWTTQYVSRDIVSDGSNWFVV